MTFSQAVQTCFQKFITIEGRARRAEYWWFLLFAVVGGIVLGALDAIAFGETGAFLAPLFNIVIFLPMLCVAVRRLHDRDMSGWWVLLNLVPLVGAIILLVIYMFPGTPGRNRFGSDPLESADDEGDGGLTPTSIPRSGRQ